MLCLLYQLYSFANERMYLKCSSSPSTAGDNSNGRSHSSKIREINNTVTNLTTVHHSSRITCRLDCWTVIEAVLEIYETKTHEFTPSVCHFFFHHWFTFIAGHEIRECRKLGAMSLAEYQTLFCRDGFSTSHSTLVPPLPATPLSVRTPTQPTLPQTYPSYLSIQRRFLSATPFACLSLVKTNFFLQIKDLICHSLGNASIIYTTLMF